MSSIGKHLYFSVVSVYLLAFASIYVNAKEPDETNINPHPETALT